MSRFNCVQLVVITMLMGVTMPGCGSGLLDTEPFSDSHRDDEGNVILEDTPRMWQDFIESVEPRIRKEMAGEQPSAGKNTWNEYWLWRIEILPENRENRDKYVDYIIDKRRQQGLPELVEQ